MSRIAVIGGTGLNRLASARDSHGAVATPYGDASAMPQRGTLAGHEVLFLARHGQPHRIAPHRVNYRANLWILRELGAEAIVATNAVGGIDRDLAPGDLVIPHQIVDYTYGREHTYFDGGELQHVEFTEPYDAALRMRLIAASRGIASVRVHDGGVYACTQGPRLESAAEIDRLERDGCTVVGMTGMPEAGLARELSLPYASACLVVNAAAGRGAVPLTQTEIEETSRRFQARIEALLLRFLESFQHLDELRR